MDWIATLRLELATAIAFLTRLPVRLETPLALAAASRGFPLAGALVGGIAAAVLDLAQFADIPPLVAALLAVGAGVIVTARCTRTASPIRPTGFSPARAGSACWRSSGIRASVRSVRWR